MCIYCPIIEDDFVIFILLSLYHRNRDSHFYLMYINILYQNYGIICKTKFKIDNEQKISSSVFQRFSIFLLISQLLNSAENSAF